MSSEKNSVNIDDLDALPDAPNTVQVSRKRKSINEKVTSELRVYGYVDQYAGKSTWLHFELSSKDTNGVFKPQFSEGKIVDESRAVKDMTEKRAQVVPARLYARYRQDKGERKLVGYASHLRPGLEACRDNGQVSRRHRQGTPRVALPQPTHTHNAVCACRSSLSLQTT